MRRKSPVDVLTPFFSIPDEWEMGRVTKSCSMYKVVAVKKGKLVSVFDGETEYWLGDRMQSRRGGASWPPLDSCYFVYPTPELAVQALLPANSKCLQNPRILVECRVRGRCYKHKGRPVFACADLVMKRFISEVGPGRSIRFFNRGPETGAGDGEGGSSGEGGSGIEE